VAGLTFFFASAAACSALAFAKFAIISARFFAFFSSMVSSFSGSAAATSFAASSKIFQKRRAMTVNIHSRHLKITCRLLCVGHCLMSRRPDRLRDFDWVPFLEETLIV
jgi:hypothetical protein